MTNRVLPSLGSLTQSHERRTCSLLRMVTASAQRSEGSIISPFPKILEGTCQPSAAGWKDTTFPNESNDVPPHSRQNIRYRSQSDQLNGVSAIFRTWRTQHCYKDVRSRYRINDITTKTEQLFGVEMDTLTKCRGPGDLWGGRGAAVTTTGHLWPRMQAFYNLSR